MVYLILMLLLFLSFVYLAYKDNEAAAVIFVLVFIAGIGPFFSYSNHANDLGTIEAQHHVVTVQQERLKSLKSSLKESVKNDAKITLLNADSPIKAIVDQIAEAESALAKAKTVQAEAEVSMARRKIGIFKFVTWMF